MIWFDRKELTKKLKQLNNDVEEGEFTIPAWFWIIGGGLIGLVSSCLKLKRKSGKPIIAKFTRKTENAEDII